VRRPPPFGPENTQRGLGSGHGESKAVGVVMQSGLRKDEPGMFVVARAAAGAGALG
jgi:hypothetical protein